MNFQKYVQNLIFKTIGFRMFSAASIVRLTMFVDVFIHFHMCHGKDGNSDVITQILEATFTRKKKSKLKFLAF